MGLAHHGSMSVSCITGSVPGLNGVANNSNLTAPTAISSLVAPINTSDITPTFTAAGT